jgi:hypothetical protein
MGRSDSRRRIAPPCLLVQCHYRALPDADGGGSPKFPSASLSTCRALKTPAQSPDASRLRVLVAGFHVGNHVALRMMLLTGLNRFRGVHPSCGLRSSLCTLTLLHSAFHSSSIVPTLGTSGWLVLTRRGLAPRKKRRASLGALPTRLATRQGLWLPVLPVLPAHPLSLADYAGRGC